MTSLPDDDNFDTRWLHESTQDYELSTVIKNLNAVKEFAYNSFDRLDLDLNGFIEANELTQLIEGNSLDNREKSFVLFLLNNREQITQADETQNRPNDGISRADLEQYFALLANLL